MITVVPAFSGPSDQQTPALYGQFFNVWTVLKKVKVRSYIAQYPVLETAQSTLHFTHRQTCSFQGHFNFSWKHSAILQLLRKDYSFRYPCMSVARYSFIQLSELWQCGMKEIAKASKWQQEDSNPGSLD